MGFFQLAEKRKEKAMELAELKKLAIRTALVVKRMHDRAQVRSESNIKILHLSP